jgi:hypothetical protein
VTTEIRTAYEVYATQVTAVEEVGTDALPGLEKRELGAAELRGGEIGLPNYC